MPPWRQNNIVSPSGGHMRKLTLYSKSFLAFRQQKRQDFYKSASYPSEGFPSRKPGKNNHSSRAPQDRTGDQSLKSRGNSVEGVGSDFVDAALDDFDFSISPERRSYVLFRNGTSVGQSYVLLIIAARASAPSGLP